MIYCYDYQSNQTLQFANTKEAAEKFDISLRCVQRGISDSWLVKNRFLFDIEEIPQIEIEVKKPKPYYVLDLKTNQVFEFNRLIDVAEYLNSLCNTNVRYDSLSRASKLHYLCIKRFFIARENDFSFIKNHRHHKLIRRIAKAGVEV